MKQSDFWKGMEFRLGEARWRCTDIGTRTVCAIKIEGKEDGWDAGPPYALAEHCLDEDDIAACEPMSPPRSEPPHDLPTGAPMTEQQREAFYAREIAPVLLDFATRCKDAGLSFLASVEWAPGETERTECLQPNHGEMIGIARAALASNSNLDALIRYLLDADERSGGVSSYLFMLRRYLEEHPVRRDLEITGSAV